MVNFVVVVVVLATISSIHCNHPHHEPPADDSFVDFARVHFMDKKKNEFMDLLPDVKNSIAKNLNEYCKEGDCDTDVANFTADHVGFYGANEKETFFEDGRFIITKLFAKTGSDKVLSKEKIGEFVTKNRDKIVEEGKVQIAYINNELVYPPRNNLDNWIIVIVSCVFCVVLIGVNLACTLKQKKSIEKEIIEREKKKQAKRNIAHSSASLNSAGGASSNRGSASGGGGAAAKAARFHEIPIQYERDERHQQYVPLMRRGLDLDEEDVRYLEPVQRFPLPADDPLLRTKRQQIRTNPHFKNTQV